MAKNITHNKLINFFAKMQFKIFEFATKALAGRIGNEEAAFEFHKKLTYFLASFPEIREELHHILLGNYDKYKKEVEKFLNKKRKLDELDLWNFHSKIILMKKIKRN